MTYKERLAQFTAEHPKLYSVYVGDLRPIPPSPDRRVLFAGLLCEACGKRDLKQTFGVWCTKCERWHQVGGNCLGKLPVTDTRVMTANQQWNNLLRIQKEAIVGLYQRPKTED